MTYIGARSAGVCKGGASPLAMFSLGVPVSLTYIKEMGTKPPLGGGKRCCAALARQNSLGVVYYASVYEVEDQHNVRSPVFGVGIYFFSVGIVRRIAAA